MRVVLFGLLAWAVLSANSARAETRRFVVAVGNNAGASKRAPLRYAETDAGKFARALVDVGGVREGDVLLLQGRTVADVTSALAAVTARVAESRHRGDLRTLVTFYFSGHGDGEALELGPERLAFSQLRGLVAGTGADVKLVVLDSCQSGGALKTKGGTATAPFTLRLVDSLNVSGDVIISASSANEAALESQELGGAFFTSHFISGLRGAADTSSDLQVTLAEAYRYAYERTVRSTALGGPGAQHPSFELNLAGQGELVLTELERAPGRLRVFTGAQRLVVIDLERDQVVVDWPISAGRELALAPGQYGIRATKDGQTRAGRVTVSKDAPATVSWEALGSSDEVVVGTLKGDSVDGGPRVNVCILPFLNASGEPAKDPLSLALAETIATDFARFDDVRLIERAQVDLDLHELEFSASKYVDPATKEAIGHVLGAQVVVVGAFQSGARVDRVNARFVAVKTGEILSTVKTERPHGRLLELQDAAARAINLEVPLMVKRFRQAQVEAR